MDRAPWMTFKEAAFRLQISRRTLSRLVDAGILVRVFGGGLLAKGVTIESVGHYEAAIEYKNQRERGLVPSLPWSTKDQSPLNHVLVTGRYPRDAEDGAARGRGPDSYPVAPVRTRGGVCAAR